MKMSPTHGICKVELKATSNEGFIICFVPLSKGFKSRPTGGTDRRLVRLTYVEFEEDKASSGDRKRSRIWTTRLRGAGSIWNAQKGVNLDRGLLRSILNLFGFMCSKLTSEP